MPKAVVEVMDMIRTMAVDAVAVQVKKKQAAVVVVQTTIMDITMKSMKGMKLKANWQSSGDR